MNIRSTDWHYRLYLFNHRLCQKFRGNTWWYEHEPSRINLCPYMRTILIWGPLLWFIHACLYVALGYAFIYLPLSVVGMSDMGWLVGALGRVAVTGLLFAVVAYGLIRVLSYFGEKRKKAKQERLELIESGVLPPPKSSSFWKMVKEYWESFHSKTCFALKVEDK